MNWPTISAKPYPPRSFRARRELVRAIRTIASTEDGKLVIAHLANFTGFYRVDDASVPSEIMRANNGKRAVFGAIFRWLRLSENEIADLEEAARQEAIADAQFGEV